MSQSPQTPVLKLYSRTTRLQSDIQADCIIGGVAAATDRWMVTQALKCSGRSQKPGWIFLVIALRYSSFLFSDKSDEMWNEALTWLLSQIPTQTFSLLSGFSNLLLALLGFYFEGAERKWFFLPAAWRWGPRGARWWLCTSLCEWQRMHGGLRQLAATDPCPPRCSSGGSGHPLRGESAALLRAALCFHACSLSASRQLYCKCTRLPKVCMWTSGISREASAVRDRGRHSKLSLITSFNSRHLRL